jgi:alkylated DNA repair dioxygenase AlkB
MNDSLDLFQAGALDILPIEGGDIRFLHAFFSLEEADAIFNELLRATPWRHEQVVVYGKKHFQPRLTAWYGDPGTDHQYSGLSLTPLPWTDLLLRLKARAENTAEASFNSVLLNLYRDGNDSVGWHSDDERELGPEPTIASLSFGQARIFQIRHRPPARHPTVKMELTHGSLLIMRGATQRNLLHAVPKSSKANGPRINLTFRSIMDVRR